MDIQIKYKEVDKKELVEKLLKGHKKHYDSNTAAYALAIDKLYKEESKEIESATIEIGKVKGVRIEAAKDMVKFEQHENRYKGNTPVVAYYMGKTELQQYIDILTKIHDQME